MTRLRRVRGTELPSPLANQATRKRLEKARQQESKPKLHRRERWIPARWRYFQTSDQWRFCWSTTPIETMDRVNGKGIFTDAEKPWKSWIEKPVGPGSRSGKAKKWVKVNGSETRHKLRKDAKQRALRELRKHKEAKK